METVFQFLLILLSGKSLEPNSWVAILEWSLDFHLYSSMFSSLLISIIYKGED